MIEKEYDMGNMEGMGRIKIKVIISNGVAVLTTNNEKLTKSMYESTLKTKHPVIWDEKNKACVSRFVGSEEDAIKDFDHYFDIAMKEQKKAREKVLRGRK